MVGELPQQPEFTTNINFSADPVKEELLCESLKLLRCDHIQSLPDAMGNRFNFAAPDGTRKSNLYREIKRKIQKLIKRLHDLYKATLNAVGISSL